jgi:photosystem II stability/assembly factor-like uncharacterized protein
VGRSAPSSKASAAPAWKLVADVSPAWQVVPTSNLDPAYDLSCPSATTCYADGMSGSGVEVSTDAGATWQASAVAPNVTVTSRVSCSGAQTCAVLGISDAGSVIDLFRTSDGGQTWSTSPLPALPTDWMVLPIAVGGSATISTFTFVTCATSTSCLVVLTASGGAEDQQEGFSFVTADGGQTWTTTSLPAGYESESGQCFADGSCLLVGTSPSGGGAALTSDDGGVSWSESSLPTGTGAMPDLSCVSASICDAIGIDPQSMLAPDSQLLVTTNGGQTFTLVPTSGFGVTNELADVTSIACVSASTCWVAGVAPTSGATWGSAPATLLGKTTGFLSVTTDGGATWTPASIPSTSLGVIQVTCPDSTVCYALAGGGWYGSESFALLGLQS